MERTSTWGDADFAGWLEDDDHPRPGRLFVDRDSPAEIAYAKYKQQLSDAWRAKPPAPVRDVPNPPPYVVPVSREVSAISDQTLRDARAVCDAAWLAYVGRLENAWREGGGL